jgi:hypothetical protein
MFTAIATIFAISIVVSVGAGLVAYPHYRAREKDHADLLNAIDAETKAGRRQESAFGVGGEQGQFAWGRRPLVIGLLASFVIGAYVSEKDIFRPSAALAELLGRITGAQ